MRRRRSALALTAVACAATALSGPAAAAAPSTAAADVWTVSDPVVTPVLADDPYTPVLIGGGEAGVEDPGDCWLTGFEDRGATGQNALQYATGCGGVLMEVTIGSDSAGVDGVAWLSATATSTYGCVHHRTGRARTVLTATHRLPGSVNRFEIPVVTAVPAPMYAFALLPLETVSCRGSERPSHLSTTVSDLEVSIEPFSTSGPEEVHEVPGSWSTKRPAATKARGRDGGGTARR